MKQMLWKKDVRVFLAALIGAFACVTLIQLISGRIDGVASMVFLLAVFFVSMYTDGYWWGVAGSVISVLAVNFAFRAPYFAFNFTIPENIFSAGIGELFVIRLAGNIIDEHQLGSIEYAAGHLGCRLVVVLGHTHCGAVDAAINSEPSGYIRYITDEIKKAIGDETDPYKASCLNVRHSVQEIEKSLCIHDIKTETGLRVVGAMYHIEDGSVEFL